MSHPTRNGKSMPMCTNCKYFRNEGKRINVLHISYITEARRCLHTENRSLVDGIIMRKPENLRNDPGACGNDAKWYEEK